MTERHSTRTRSEQAQDGGRPHLRRSSDDDEHEKTRHDPEDPVTARGVGHVPASYTTFLDRHGLQGARLGIVREPMGPWKKPMTTIICQSPDLRMPKMVM